MSLKSNEMLIYLQNTNEDIFKLLYLHQKTKQPKLIWINKILYK